MINFTNKKGLKRLLSLILVITLFATMLTGCEKKPSKAQVQKDFDAYIEKEFVEALQEDAFTVNYFIKNPEKYGLENATNDMTFDTKEEYEQSFVEDQAELDYIKKTFPYEKLTEEQKVTYDVLVDAYTRNLALKDFYYYQTPLGSYLGINASLPILLSELRFDTEKDILNYFDVLEQTQGYFEGIIRFQNEKIAQGTLEADFVLEGIVEQCNNYINGEENFLIPVMNDKIDGATFLDSSKKEEYKQKNVQLVSENFTNAYKYLGDEVSKLVGKGMNQEGLAKLPQGKQYYQALFALNTGTDVTVDEAKKDFDKYRKKLLNELIAMVTKEPALAETVMSFQLEKSDTTTVLNNLSSSMKNDFPAIPETQFEVKDVHESLQENSSPAMYFISPIDTNDTLERITINPKSMNNNNYLFTTLAHEGYPGHLYQHVYSKNTDIPELRYILSYSGYKDGWATYIESYVLKYLDDEDAKMMKLLDVNDMFTNLTLCIADIGINYEGWSLDETAEFLNEYLPGVDVQMVYEQLVEVPTNYSQYFYTAYVIEQLRDKAKVELGDKFTDVGFHKAILDPGPAPFAVVEKSVDKYIKDAKK